jgi:hypothetical protein
MKVGKKILNFIFVLVIALSFTFIGVKSVVFKTIFNKEYVLEQMENNNFYSETYFIGRNFIWLEIHES